MARSTKPVLRDGEPRGDVYGEPRDDDLTLMEIDGEPHHWENADGERVCGSVTTRRGWKWRRCQQPRIDKHNHRCSKHGALQPKGKASPNYAHGKYSQYLPDRLAERYERMIEETDLASVRDEMISLDTRLAEILERANVQPSNALWEEMSDAVADAMDGDDGALQQVEQLVEKGLDREEAWEEVYAVVEQRRKLVETENKRRKISQETMTPEEVSMVVDFLTEHVLAVFEKYDVPDEARREIATAAQRIKYG